MRNLLQSRPFQRFWAIAGAVSLRTKVLGIILGTVLLLGLGITIQVRTALTRTLRHHAEEMGISITRDLAARSTDLLLINDLYALHRLLHETQVNNPDVVYAFVVDPDGRVLAHTFEAGFPKDLANANTVAPDAHHHAVHLMTDEGAVWDIAVPIFDGRIGTMRVGLSEASMQQTVTAITWQLLLTTVLVSAFGVAAATFLTWILTRPILSLVRAAQAVERGDLTPRVSRWADDEIGDMAEAFNAMTEGLAKAARERAEREQLRARYVNGVITAQEEERKRVARELHDGTGQALTSLLVSLRTLEDLCDRPLVRERVTELRKMVGDTLKEVHELAVQLRPSVLDDLGLPAAIERHIADYCRLYEISIDLAIHGLGGQRLPAAVETTLYRIIQEALANVARHAQAQTASVLLEKRDNMALVIVEDDGRGFDPHTVNRNDRHLGLYGIRERVKLFGGKFTVESEPGKGTSLFVEIPLDTQSKGSEQQDVSRIEDDHLQPDD